MSLKSTNKIETNKYELEIEVSADTFEAAVEKAYQKEKKNITIQGFRKGKAPRKFIEKVYGEGVFYEDAVNAVIPTSLEEAITEAALDLVCRPDVDVTEVKKETGVVYKAVCTVKPEVSVANYKGIEAEKVVNTVTDEDINAEIEKLRKKGERIVTVEDRAAQNGDDVVIDFEGFLDDVAFDGGKAEKFNLTLGSGQFIPGFEEQVVGHNIDEEFDINVTFPEGYQSEELAGKAVVFKIKLHEIKEHQLPELDDDFVKDTTEFNTIDELKADFKTKLEEAALNKAESEFEGKLLDAVIDGMTAEVPEVMYENRVNDMVSELGQRLSSQGINIDLYLQYTGMTIDALKKTYEEQAQKQVKLRLALEEIVKLENIEATEDELNTEFAKIAEQYKMEVEEVKKYIRSEDLAKDICIGKAVELIKSNAVAK